MLVDAAHCLGSGDNISAMVYVLNTSKSGGIFDNLMSGGGRFDSHDADDHRDIKNSPTMSSSGGNLVPLPPEDSDDPKPSGGTTPTKQHSPKDHPLIHPSLIIGTDKAEQPIHPLLEKVGSHGAEGHTITRRGSGGGLMVGKRTKEERRAASNREDKQRELPTDVKKDVDQVQKKSSSGSDFKVATPKKQTQAEKDKDATTKERKDVKQEGQQQQDLDQKDPENKESTTGKAGDTLKTSQ